jgi:hypothetical protein
MIQIFRWAFTAAGLWLLKKGLAHRLKGENARWIQPYSQNEIVNREVWLLDYCTGKTVFHIGFADAPFTEEKLKKGTLLHTALKKVASDLSGIDSEAHSVARYRELTGDTGVKAATLDAISPAELQAFNTIVAGEILEHLPDPSLFIQELYLKMYSGQELLVTVPNYISFDSLAAALNNTESVHPDHEWYFSPYTLSKKFDEKNWKLKTVIPAMYGSRNTNYNFVRRAFPGLSDCLIAVIQKK